MRPKCLLLDFDNTLVSYWDGERKALQTLYHRYQVKGDKEEFLMQYLVYNKQLWDEFEQNKRSIPEIVIERFNYMKRLYPELDADPADLNCAYLDAFVESTEIDDEHLQAVKQLKAMGYPIIIVSNGIHDIQERRIEHIGLKPLIDGFVSSEEAGKPKPAPDIFELSLQKARKLLGDLTTDTLLMVGDNYLADVLGARDFGIPAVWVDEVGDNSKNEEDRIQSFPELVEWLAGKNF